MGPEVEKGKQPNWPRGLSEEGYRQALRATKVYLQQHEYIRNRDIRKLVPIGYDQAIAFFNRAVAEHELERLGLAGSSRYVSVKSS